MAAVRDYWDGRFILPLLQPRVGMFLDRCGFVLVRPAFAGFGDVSIAGGTDILGGLSVAGEVWCAGRRG